ncbi:MAG: guanylate kinase [Deltaproteobacteria bacterium]|nr:guanylate kinase [Deltaproteobacteria bacterium]
MSGRRGIPFVLAAGSGAGKTTLSLRLLERVPGLALSISYTTRPPRGVERDGVEYHFVDEPTFRQMVESGAFIEWARVHDRYYGSGFAATESRLGQGIDLLFDIDVQGGEQLKRRFPESCLIWIDAPSWEVLEQRLRGRGTDDEAAIQKRLSNARAEQARAHRSFDHVVVNDDLERATGELIGLIEQARDREKAHTHPRQLSAVDGMAKKKQ